MFSDDGSKRQLGASSSSTEEKEGAQYSAYTPLQDGLSESRALRRHLIKRLKHREFETLVQEFKAGQYSPAFIEQFLNKQYRYIFDWLLAGSQETRSFELILELFPHEVLKTKLRTNNFQLLMEFLAGRQGMEKRSRMTEALNTLDQEKFRLLLSLDPEGVQGYMAKTENPFMCESTLNIYRAALESFSNQNAERERATK